MTQKGPMLVGKISGPVTREVQLDTLQKLKGVGGRVAEHGSGFGKSEKRLFDFELIISDS